jgi:hypothetical protein
MRQIPQYLKYGVPAAAGLATGGYALSQGEDPGSAGLAAIAGGLGGGAGLLGARALAGKYAPLTQKEPECSWWPSNRSIPCKLRLQKMILNQTLGSSRNFLVLLGNLPDQVTPRNLGKAY